MTHQDESRYTPLPTNPFEEHRQALLYQAVDIELNGSTAFRHTRQLCIPRRGGVYLIHDLRGVLYVGRTCNLYRRFYEHYWSADNERLSLVLQQPFGDLRFSWAIVENEGERAALETRLIAWLRPICNRFFPSIKN